MALTFYYSTVNAGKTSKLILDAHAHKSRSVRTMVLLPEIALAREDGNTLSARSGLSCEITSLLTDKCPLALFENLPKKPEVIFIDEAQFLKSHQVKGLCNITDTHDVPVFAFGLRTNFYGEPFEGSIYLMSWADRIMEIPTSSAKEKHVFATMNIKVCPDTKERTLGEEIDIGFNYEPVSRKFFNLDNNWVRRFVQA
jgi:thymidine kinase